MNFLTTNTRFKSKLLDSAEPASGTLGPPRVLIVVWHGTTHILLLNSLFLSRIKRLTYIMHKPRFFTFNNAAKE